MDQQIITLPNGLRAVFKPSTSPIAHACIVINVGSRDELPDQLGIAHFTEHLIFKKTQKRTTNQILNRLELVGADLNAYTTKEYTCIHASFLTQHLGRTLDLFEDILFHSTFPPKEVDKEKGIILDEIASYQDSPEDAIADDFEDFLFANHELGHNILGTEDALKNLNKSHFEAFVGRFYQPENMVVGITANYTEKKVRKLLEKYFGAIPSVSNSQQRTPPPLVKNQHISISKPINQVHYVLGGQAYSIYSPKKTALMILNNMLGGMGMSSKLNLEIREKHGIAYTIESNFTPYSDTGVFNIYLGTESEKMEKARKLVIKELNKIRDKKISATQLKQAKNKLIGQIALGEENRIALIIALAKNIIDHGEVDTLEKIYSRINNVSSEQILEVANEIFHPDNLNSLIFRPVLDEN